MYVHIWYYILLLENKEPPSRKRSDSLDTDKTSPDVDLQPHTKKVKSTDGLVLSIDLSRVL